MHQLKASFLRTFVNIESAIVAFLVRNMLYYALTDHRSAKTSDGMPTFVCGIVGVLPYCQSVHGVATDESARADARNARRTGALSGTVIQMTMRDLLLRYKQMVMGFAGRFMPPANTLVFSVIFTRVAHIDTGCCIRFVLRPAGLNFTASSLLLRGQPPTSNTSLVSKVYFPREIFLSAVLVSLADSPSASGARRHDGITTSCRRWLYWRCHW